MVGDGRAPAALVACCAVQYSTEMVLCGPTLAFELKKNHTQIYDILV